MKKMNRVFVKSFVFAGALTLAAVVGTGSAEASGNHGDRTESQGHVQAKDEFYGKHNQKPAARERHDRYAKHENHARPQKTEKERNCNKAENVKQPVKAERPAKVVKPVKAERPAKVVKPVKAERPAKVVKPVKEEKPVKVVKPVKEEKAVKTEKPVKDKSHSQGAEHASETAKLHANPNSAIFAGETEKEEPSAEEPKKDESADVVVETPAVEDEKDTTEVEAPAATDTEEAKKDDQVTDDQDATHEDEEDADKEESHKGEKVQEVLALFKKIRSLVLENAHENDKLFEAINAAILAFEDALKEDTSDDADVPAVPEEDHDEVEVEVSTL
ncbi:hypothetical protein [Fictibacillus barbaricus]|uniref:Uncharacterized protein n=1 Tax=Fictibacillus barbaricus TaxID=182136 RepID=A0ABU1U5B0_9BACL|nr:hypothetical protein [Fictibacillus barbaricus]MDR7074596.1 hypothetical protein [Fictibacillus barbaricus]